MFDMDLPEFLDKYEGFATEEFLRNAWNDGQKMYAMGYKNAELGEENDSE